jgi:hypothetical protein
MGVQSEWFGVPQGQGGQSMQAGVYEALIA